MNPQAAKRYESDPIYHNFISALVRLMNDGTLTRGDVIDALQIAERIIFEMSMRDAPQGAENTRQR